MPPGRVAFIYQVGDEAQDIFHKTQKQMEFLQ